MMCAAFSLGITLAVNVQMNISEICVVNVLSIGKPLSVNDCAVIPDAILIVIDPDVGGVIVIVLTPVQESVNVTESDEARIALGLRIYVYAVVVRLDINEYVLNPTGPAIVVSVPLTLNETAEAIVILVAVGIEK
jgi:hypothetical protein